MNPVLAAKHAVKRDPAKVAEVVEQLRAMVTEAERRHARRCPLPVRMKSSARRSGSFTRNSRGARCPRSPAVLEPLHGPEGTIQKGESNVTKLEQERQRGHRLALARRLANDGEDAKTDALRAEGVITKGAEGRR